MSAPETAPAASGDVSADVRYVVTRDGSTIRFQHRRVQASRAHPLAFVLVVLVWSLLEATGAPWFLWVPALLFVPGAVLFVFDEERYRGRRQVRRELSLRFDGPSSYRAGADVHVEVDGEVLQGAADARLVFRRWTDPLISNSRATIRTELCLVAARRVYLLATSSLSSADAEAGDPSRLADATEWRARTVHGLAIGLLEATEERLPVDPTPFQDPEVYRPPFSPWPVAILGQLLAVACGCLVGIHALAAFRAPTTDWQPAAYLGLFALVALPAPLGWNMARTSARAPALLRSLYGDVEPFPPGLRWRPWPAFLLAVALPVAFSLGWLRLFPQLYPW